jgi:putative flippase GtrA
LNGFYWNSRWTFRSADASNRRQQFVRFIAVNVVGMALNTTIVLYLTISLTSNGHASNRMQILPKVVATVIVMFWNFFANKFWTFKPSKSLEPMAEVTK